jgi:hypothetical protein
VDPFHALLLRSATGLAGAIAYPLVTRLDGWRAWASTVVLGWAFPLIFEPMMFGFIIENYADKVPWFTHDEPNGRMALAFIMGLAGCAIIRFLVWVIDGVIPCSSDSPAVAWLIAKIRTWLGIPGTVANPNPSPTPRPKPDSDAQPTGR